VIQRWILLSQRFIPQPNILPKSLGDGYRPIYPSSINRYYQQMPLRTYKMTRIVSFDKNVKTINEVECFDIFFSENLETPQILSLE
jgi:hypothetical protein